MTPQFLYFDMGNVLLRFSHERMAQQVARVAGISSERVRQILFEEGDGLHWTYEHGQLSRDRFYAQFCDRAGAKADASALQQAGNDIFELNVPIVGLLGHLVSAGYDLGVFSNTTSCHWDHCISRFAILTNLFRVHALSFRLVAMKPDPAAYQKAAELAGAPPDRIFFTDDREENVAGAKAAGWDAVLFQSVSQVNQELRARGIVTNY
jgi:putative hydrolase of the HAD superfamily